MLSSLLNTSQISEASGDVHGIASTCRFHSEDFSKSGGLTPPGSCTFLGFLCLLPRHSQQRLTPSSDIQNQSYRAFWKLPEAAKISRAKLFGLEVQLQHSQVA